MVLLSFLLLGGSLKLKVVAGSGLSRTFGYFSAGGGIPREYALNCFGLRPSKSSCDSSCLREVLGLICQRQHYSRSKP